MNFKIPSIRMEGIINLSVVRNGKVVREYPEFRNTITNTGLDTFLSSNTGLSTSRNQCKVGTGTAPILVTDTTLPGYAAWQSGGTETNVSQFTTAPYYVESFRTYEFAINALVGTFGNIGLANSTGAVICFGTQIKDSNGNPTTITLVTGEQLRAVYRVRTYVPGPAVSTGEMNINGSPVPYTRYVRRITASISGGIWLPSMTLAYAPNYPVPTSVFDPDTSFGTGATSFQKNTTAAAYTPGTFSREFYAVYAAAEANIANPFNVIRYFIGSAGTGGNLAGYVDYVIPSGFTKNSLQTLTVHGAMAATRYSEE